MTTDPHHPTASPGVLAEPGSPQPCLARPHAGLVHPDGTCRCFTGGPAPEHAARPEDTLLGLAFHGAA
jgi:hypothetical protein